jgi:hypothetical protein
MKYALITPPAGLMLIKVFNLGYQFVLPQYLNDSLYKGFYQKLHYEGHFLLMDNGAAELGEGIPDEDLVKAAEEVGADEIVMPDVLDNTKATLERTYAAHRMFPAHKRAMCPQGTNWDEWEYCASVMLNMGCATLCVAKRYESLPGGRVHALYLIEHNGWHRDHHIHLLGCSKDPLHEAEAAFKRAPWVRGIDTAAPVAYAQAGWHLNLAPHHCSLDWDVGFDLELAYDNIQLFLEASRGKDAYNIKE